MLAVSGLRKYNFSLPKFQANANANGRVINMDNNGSCTTQAKYIIFDSCYFTNVTDAASIAAVKFGGCDYFQVTNCVFKDIPNCDALDFNVCHHGLISGNRFESCLQAGHIKVVLLISRCSEIFLSMHLN